MITDVRDSSSAYKVQEVIIMTVRELVVALVESGIDINSEISVAVPLTEGEWEYISLTKNIVDYGDGTCAIITK